MRIIYQSTLNRSTRYVGDGLLQNDSESSRVLAKYQASLSVFKHAGTSAYSVLTFTALGSTMQSRSSRMATVIFDRGDICKIGGGGERTKETCSSRRFPLKKNEARDNRIANFYRCRAYRCSTTSIIRGKPHIGPSVTFFALDSYICHHSKPTSYIVESWRHQLITENSFVQMTAVAS